MKSTLVTVSIRLFAAALFAGAAATAYAQEEQIIVTVPFDFVVGAEHLSAGKYVIRPESEDPGVVWIEKADGREAAVTLTIPVKESGDRPSKPELIFDARGDQHVLARVVEADGSTREIVPGHAKTERASAAVNSGGVER